VTLRDASAGGLDGYKALVVPPGGGSVAATAGIQLVTRPAGIRPGLGS